MIEVGDEVIFKSQYTDYKAKVFGIAKDTNVWNEKYAITYIGYDGTRMNRVVREDQLQEKNLEEH